MTHNDFVIRSTELSAQLLKNAAERATEIAKRLRKLESLGPRNWDHQQAEEWVELEKHSLAIRRVNLSAIAEGGL